MVTVGEGGGEGSMFRTPLPTYQIVPNEKILDTTDFEYTRQNQYSLSKNVPTKSSNSSL